MPLLPFDQRINICVINQRSSGQFYKRKQTSLMEPVNGGAAEIQSFGRLID